jgi:hypothetical protein
MGLVISKGLTLRKGYIPIDTDAANYAMRVEAADGEPLEADVFNAINAFVLGCKADGIWNAIKASCILAGARTLTGALVPLVGAAPTNVGGLFVSGDYNRKTGLVGDGSTKYLNSNRNNNADPQDNHHISVFQSSITNVLNQVLLGHDNNSSGSSGLQHTVGNYAFRSRNAAETGARVVGVFANTFMGITRSSTSTAIRRVNKANSEATQNSQTSSATDYAVFADLRLTLGPHLYSNARIAFYSIGESLDLALLDARVTDLINAFAAAIP